MKRQCPVLLIAAALSFAGCTSMARRLEVPTVKQIVAGKTTRAEVEKRLGYPKESILGANGTTVARYFFHQFIRSTDASWVARRDHPGDILFRAVTLQYGASNIVEKKTYDETVTPIFQTNGWLFAGPDLSAANVSLIQRGVDGERDVVARLGEPTSRSFDTEGRTILVWISARMHQTRRNNFPAKRLMVVLRPIGIVGDYVLIESSLGQFEPLRLH